MLAEAAAAAAAATATAVELRVGLLHRMQLQSLPAERAAVLAEAAATATAVGFVGRTSQHTSAHFTDFTTLV